MKWEERRLDELGVVKRGRSRHRPRNAPHLYGGPYPFVQTSDAKHAHFYLSNCTQTYSDAGLSQSRMWPSGTLCITIAANIAETAILGIDACFPDSIIGFIPKDNVVDVRFVKYCFEATMQRRYRQFSQGATQDNLSLEKLLSLKLNVPEISIQREIADRIAAYDDLIENNQRRIQLLESAARLLYKEWFVHFRFPGYEHVKIKDGVPEGWERVKLSDIADIVMGQSPKSIYYNTVGEGLPFHQGVTSFGARFPRHEVYCVAKNRIAESGDILFSVRAPVGRLNIALDQIVLGRGLSAIRSKHKFQNLLYYALKHTFFKEDLIGGGAIYASIKKQDLLDVKLLYASRKLIELFMEYVRPIDEEIACVHKAMERAARARDLLLPKLMSGEIEV